MLVLWKNKVSSFSQENIGESLAIASLFIYVVGDFAFMCSAFLATYPVLRDWTPYDITTSVSMGLAVAAIVARARDMDPKMIVLIAISTALLWLSAMHTKDYLLLYTLIIMIAIGGIRFEKLSYVYGVTILVILSFAMLAAVLGLLYNKDVVPNDRLVFSYGFGHPNSLGAFLFTALAALGFTCWNKRAWGIPLVLSIMAAVFSYVALSSHTAALSLAALAAAIALGHAPGFRDHVQMPRRVFFSVLIVVPAVILAIMLAGTMFYDNTNPVFAFLDKMLHGRLYFAHEYFVNNGGMTLFGRECVHASSYHSGLPFASVDSGYCRLFLITGLAPLCAIAAIYAISVRRLSIDNPHFLIFAILLIGLCYLMLEEYQLHIAWGILPLFVSYAFAGMRDARRKSGDVTQEP